MATKTITKYDMIQVGDRIEFPFSFSLIKSGIVETIKGLNQHHKEIRTTNGGYFIVSRYQPNAYQIYRDRNHIATA